MTICADWGNHAGHRCDSDGARGSWLIPDDDEDEDEEEEEEEEEEDGKYNRSLACVSLILNARSSASLCFQ